MTALPGSGGSVHVLEGPPDAELAAALARFEERFDYPLGEGRRFRIDHGEDYGRFFRSLGTGAVVVVRRGGRVLGTLGVALRTLALPPGERRTVAYCGDLRIDADARGGRTLLHLAGAARDWIAGRAEAACAVVMGGTRAEPRAYTGRGGLPVFEPLGAVVILRFDTGCATGGGAPGGAPGAGATMVRPGSGGGAGAMHGSRSIPGEAEAGAPMGAETRARACRSAPGDASEEDADRIFDRLATGHCVLHGGDAALRSLHPPLWIVDPDGGACGRIEDTHRAKRLRALDGASMEAAHLARFAFDDPVAAAAVLRVALARARERGFPYLFTSVDPASWEALRPAVSPLAPVVAPATVFGTRLPSARAWVVDSSEI